MQLISIGGQTSTSESLTAIVFPSAMANLTDGVLRLRNMQGGKGESAKGDDWRISHSNLKSRNVTDLLAVANRILSGAWPGGVCDRDLLSWRYLRMFLK